MKLQCIQVSVDLQNFEATATDREQCYGGLKISKMPSLVTFQKSAIILTCDQQVLRWTTRIMKDMGLACKNLKTDSKTIENKQILKRSKTGKDTSRKSYK
jgi:hypothetical protein